MSVIIAHAHDLAVEITSIPERAITRVNTKHWHKFGQKTLKTHKKINKAAPTLFSWLRIKVLNLLL